MQHAPAREHAASAWNTRRRRIDTGLIVCSFESSEKHRTYQSVNNRAALGSSLPGAPRENTSREIMDGVARRCKHHLRRGVEFAPAGGRVRSLAQKKPRRAIGYRGGGEGIHHPAKLRALAHGCEAQQDEESYFQLMSNHCRLHFSVLPPKAGRRVFLIQYHVNSYPILPWLGAAQRGKILISLYSG